MSEVAEEALALAVSICETASTERLERARLELLRWPEDRMTDWIIRESSAEGKAVWRWKADNPDWRRRWKL